MPEGILKSRFMHEDGLRQEGLQRARLCASLSKPWVLPPQEHDNNSRLPENYQAEGSRGGTSLTGKLLTGLFPAGVPWLRLDLAGQIKFDPRVPDEAKQREAQALFLRELLIQPALESVDVNTKGRRRAGFRSRKRASIEQFVITGDSLEQITDNLNIKVFRRDQYITKRDQEGNVLYHGIKEVIDPLAHAEDAITAGINLDEARNKPAGERMEELYTFVEWQPESKRWVIRQELNKIQVRESEEVITPFISTPYELAAEADYGIGVMEQNLGDLQSLDELNKRKIDYAGEASKVLWALDNSSNARPADLAKPSGSILEGPRVQGGQVQDVAMLRADKLADMSIVQSTTEQLKRDLAGAFLSETGGVRDSERTTAFEVQMTTLRELEGALGGVFSEISDNQQLPTVDRTIHVLEKKNMLPPVQEGLVDVQILTGISALSRDADLRRMMQFTEVVANLGPEAMQRLNIGVLLDVFQRHLNLFQPGLVKSDEQLAQEREQAQQAMLSQAAGEQAIASTGKIAEQAAAAETAA